MRTISALLFLSAVSLIGVLPAAAQQARRSPHETISAKIDDNRVSIVYGRPYTKAPGTGEMRKIWGGLVPFDKIWRMGADEATLFITQKDVKVGDQTIPAGAYTLFLYPTEQGAQLIFNKEIGQWGIDPYDSSHELTRVELQKEPVEPAVDQFTISLARNPAGGGLLRLAWENTQYSVGYTVAR